VRLGRALRVGPYVIGGEVRRVRQLKLLVLGRMLLLVKMLLLRLLVLLLEIQIEPAAVLAVARWRGSKSRQARGRHITQALLLALEVRRKPAARAGAVRDLERLQVRRRE
jgi:hypothetical protein